MAKVFVSSTVADLKRERQAVMDWLRAARHQAIESYLPDSDTVRASFLDDVATCDLYVLILGHRYGFVPADDNPEGLSITELEFRRAGQAGIPRIALLRTSIPDVSVSDMENPDRSALVRAFRAEVTREVRAAEFHDLSGLIQGLSTGVQAELQLARRPVSHMAKVFVSSTVADLKRERQAVMDWLRAARHQAIESYLPDSDTVRASFLDDVATCDLYVLILGHRYGFVPADDNPEGLSITQMEFRRAGECGIPRVALVRTNIPDERLSDLQDPARAALVWAFRAEVARTVRPAEFSDEKGLIQGLSTAVAGELATRPPGEMGRILRLAPRPVFLAGREELLAELEARLAGDSDGGPRIVALTGLGGAGKTSVALEYAHRHLGEVEVTWQFPAEDPTVLAAAMGELAAQLGAADSGDPVAAVHTMLAGYGAGWLLVFDNAPDQASVAAFVPPAGRGRVLITSRNPFWPPGQALEVPVLDTGVAAEFLADRTGDADNQAARELAGELGGLPLALEQAAGYIQASDGSLAAYLALFRRRRPELLARGDSAGYPGTVATAWALAFGQLEQSDPTAAGLLRLLAFCAPDAVPLGLLLQSRPGLTKSLPQLVAKVLTPLLGDALAVNDAVAALRRYSLVRPAGDGAVSVHRLVQAVTADQMPAGLHDAWLQAAAMLIEAWAESLRREWRDRLARRNLVGQIMAVAEAAARFPEETDQLTLEILALRGLAVSFLIDLGDNATQAISAAETLLPDQERILGPDHPSVLASRGNLAIAYRAAGRADEAVTLHERTVADRERVLGPEHPDTMSSRNNLANAYRAAGRADEAIPLHERTVADRERVLGPEHPDTMSSRNNLANALQDIGRTDEAITLHERTLADRERILGPDHPDTADSRNNLASAYQDIGRTDEAITLHERTLADREPIFGPDHPDSVDSRNNLANAYWAAGRTDEAVALYERTLADRERMLGPDHPDIRRFRNGLAAVRGDRSAV